MGGFDSLHDGLSDKLANVARNIQMEEDKDDDDEWEDEEFEFRPDPFKRGSTYYVRHLFCNLYDFVILCKHSGISG